MRGFTPVAIVWFLSSIILCFPLPAQQAGRSIVREDADRYGRYGLQREEMWDSLNGRTGVQAPPAVRADGCSLNRIVFGWHPYWAGTAYRTYDYRLLSDICYFSYEVDPATGGYTTLHDWKTTDMVPLAKAAGTRVHLCATLFEGHATLLGNPASVANLIDSLVALVRLRDADGVNIDFEGVPASQRAAVTAFMRDLAARLHAKVPSSTLSIALPSVDWDNVYDVAAMAPYVDLFIIMGYDYHWGGAPDAGPVAPKNNGTLWTPYDVTRSVNTYLKRGIPAGRLSLGVPYYGYDWPAADSTPGAATLGGGESVVYSAAARNAATHGRRWEPQSSTPYYIYRKDSVWRQCWYDDSVSLRAKYDLVMMKNLAGIGIWALSYDGSSPDLWNTIRNTFTSCAHSECAGTFTDMGGPAGGYYDNDRYSFTIAPERAGSVTLDFFSFSIANDLLTIYDGRDTLAPVIGRFTGTASPGSVVATSGALTLKFVSDSGGTSWGWIANWNCAPAAAGVARADEVRRPDIEAYPNPFSRAAVIEYRLAREADIELSLVDALGERVATIVRRHDVAGRYRVQYQVASDIPAGWYMVVITAGGISGRRPIVIR
ncbi:MAG: putative sporulation-specific glycosylase YdhD [Chlorobi bacterium]|nr:putative sporulation-specific glycosylase YdhD [Chlorobiota bacterium]